MRSEQPRQDLVSIDQAAASHAEAFAKYNTAFEKHFRGLLDEATWQAARHAMRMANTAFDSALAAVNVQIAEARNQWLSGDPYGFATPHMPGATDE
jgi:hypothetical protein